MATCGTLISVGKKRDRMMFTPADLDEFVERRTRRKAHSVSVYKSKKSPYYWYDFECRSRRFYGSTKRTTKREAEEVERHERERANRAMKASLAVTTSLLLDHVAGRYWEEVGQHHAGADNT